MRLDRRQFLAAAATTAISAGTVARATSQVAKLRDFSVKKRLDKAGQLKRLTITTSSGGKWEIDTAAYAGNPRLLCTQGPDGTLISLTGARMPGTAFGVNFEASIRPQILGHELRIAFSESGVRQAAIKLSQGLEDWIDGKAELSREVSAADRRRWVGDVGELAKSVETEVRCTGTLQFLPSNQFVFAGNARIEDLATTELVIGPTVKGTLRLGESAATGIEGRRDGEWRGYLSMESDTWKVEGERNALDLVRVELHENGEGAVAIAGTGTGWNASSRDRLSFAVTSPLFVRSLGKAEGVAVQATLGESGWLSAAGVQVQLSPVSEEATLFASQDAAGSSFELPDLRLSDLAVQFGDDVSATVTEVEGQVRVGQDIKVRDTALQVKRDVTGQIKVGPADFGILLPANFKLDVVRREDMLSLRYEFVNLSISSMANKAPRLVRSSANKAAYIIITFPPQSVTEQLVRENNPPQVPNDIRAAGARMSGHTRLVFFIPTNVTPTFNLIGDDGKGTNGLLDWDSWQISIVPTAVSTYANNSLIKVDPSFMSPTSPELYKDFGKFKVGGEPSPEPEPTARPFPSADDQTRRTDQVQARPGAINAQGPMKKIEEYFPVTPALVDVTKIYKIIPTERMELNPRLHTAIEMPTRLILSPNESAAWIHARGLKTSPAGKTEIWHTQLGTRVGPNTRAATDGGSAYYSIAKGEWSGPFLANSPTFPTVRAVDAVDYGVAMPPLIPENAAQDQIMTTDQRRSLVDTMTCRLPAHDAPPVNVRRLMLSPLGGWLKSFGNWSVAYNAKGKNEYPPLVVAWTHLATMGRDHYVRVVTQGYLYPTGHPCAKIEITERKVQRTTNGKILAINRKKTFIVVRKPLVNYNTDQQRALGFKSIRILTGETPPLKVINSSDVLNGQSGFFLHWITTTKGPFNFIVRGEDVEGRSAEWAMPLIYVSDQLFVNADKTMKSKAQVDQLVGQIRLHYDGQGNPPASPQRRISMSGQKLAFAPDTDGKPASVANSKETTAYPVDEAFFTSVTKAGDVFDFKAQRAPWSLSLYSAKLQIPAAAYMSGAAKPGAPVEIRISDRYIQHGFDLAQNSSQVFLKKLKKGIGDSLKFPDAGKAGGLLNPDMVLGGFAKGRGPVGGPESVLEQALPQLFASDFLPDTGKILGAVRLLDLIPSTIPLTPFEPKPGQPEEPKDPNAYKSPMLMIVVEKDANGLPTKANVIFKWLPEIKSWPATGKPLLFCSAWSVAKKEPLYLTARLSIDLKGGPTSFTMLGTFKKFGVDCIGPVESFIKLTFEELRFEASDTQGMKIVLNPKWPKTEFVGPLTFVQKLLDVFKDAGLDLGSDELMASTELARYDGLTFKPFLDVTLDKIRAGFTLGIPNIGIGVLSIMNMSLSAEVVLPIMGDNLRVRFAFCERESPFRLSVMGFAGGGFIAITVSPDDVEILEASFEFGGNLSLDIGVASGGISLMAGIYFKLENKACLLEGYVKLQGRLSVLGLIKITITFELSLTYTDEGGNPRAFGTATVTVEVEVLFFSASVSMTVQKQFAGAKSSSGALSASTDGGFYADAKPLKFTEAVTSAEWQTYCGAFA